MALLAAPRPGAAGRQGNTVGAYLCADLACSLSVCVGGGGGKEAGRGRPARGRNAHPRAEDRPPARQPPGVPGEDRCRRHGSVSHRAMPLPYAGSAGPAPQRVRTDAAERVGGCSSDPLRVSHACVVL
ncbi:FBP domain-containing protein, partial [Streptomyces albus]|uniref:FBP domain-containing protein n=1 Tax=Streptomyces albus TaxID=1888 RepID=UPI003D2FE200